MREKIKDPGRIEHILSAIEKIEQNRGKFNDEDILNNTIIFFGFVKLIEIIGEASYKLTGEFKQTHSSIPWSDIEGMRHVLVHGYYAIEPIDVIKTISYDIPSLKAELIKIKNNLKI